MLNLEVQHPNSEELTERDLKKEGTMDKLNVPGPKARAIIERDKKVVSSSYPRGYPFVMDHGKGVEVWDPDGNRFIDFMSGIAVLSTGHANPRVVKAVQNAAEKFLHISSDFYHEDWVRLSEKLDEIAPFEENDKTFLTNSGTEAVETAIKLAKFHTKRHNFIGFSVGGTSAGLAIQGQFVFDACNNTVTSDTILANPYNRRASFTTDFFAWEFLGGVMTDSHFVTRERMGRLMGFLARQIQDGVAGSALGLGINEVTSVVVDKHGLATVIGEGPAYFVLADHPPEVCAARQDLSFSGYKIWKVEQGGNFDLANRPSAGYYEVDVTEGVLSAVPY